MAPDASAIDVNESLTVCSQNQMNSSRLPLFADVVIGRDIVKQPVLAP
jgi:hypothetical protein